MHQSNICEQTQHVFWLTGQRRRPHNAHFGVMDGSQIQGLAPKLARIGAQVAFNEARSTNLSPSMIDDIPVGSRGGAVHLAGNR